jgi:hypothetical protein
MKKTLFWAIAVSIVVGLLITSASGIPVQNKPEEIKNLKISKLQKNW